MFRRTVICLFVLIVTHSFLSAETRAVGANIEDTLRNTPLLVARQSLLLARSRVAEHHFSDAIPALLTTAEALAFIEEQEIGQYDGFGAVAGDTRQQVLDYASAIETDNCFALSNIDSWLAQVRQWSERRKTTLPSSR